MKIYCINLKRSIERRARMEAELKKTGLEFEFIDAVDGRTLSEEDLKRKYSHWRTRFRYGIGLTRGEIGCSLSHVKFFDRIIDSDSVGFVVEDDVSFADGARHAFEEVGNFLRHTEGPAIVQLPGLARDLCRGGAEGKSLVRASGAMGTYAYGINPAGARLMKKVFTPVTLPADKYAYVIRHFGLNFFVYNKCVISVDMKGESQVGSDRKRYNGLARLGYKMWRCVGLSLDWILSQKEWVK